MQQARSTLAVLLVAVILTGSLRPLQAQAQEPVATFTSGVAVVPISAVVRDGRRRLVRNLRLDDFQVIENGRTRPIVDFRATDHASVSIGLLFDTSGSMRGANFDTGLAVVEQVLGLMTGDGDEMALFTFDRELRQETEFGTEIEGIRCALDSTRPWGMTSLYDAVAATARALEARPADRRAVVVITDGIDTSSALSSVEASARASEIDVPVYIVAVVPPPHAHEPKVATERGHDLSSLAGWTGGDVRYVPRARHAEAAVALLVSELRHQYFFAIESSTLAGNHRIDVRARKKELNVRARSGYLSTGG
jgi:Ca-activated chloride channel family protein